MRLALAKILIGMSVLLTNKADKDISMRTKDTAFKIECLKDVSLMLELMDERETTHVLINEDDRAPIYDVEMMRRRYKSLSLAPSVVESERFPDRDAINKFIVLNRQYKNDLEERLKIDLLNRDQIEMVIGECERLYNILDYARDTKSNYYYITVRRMSLQTLRELIGDEAFYSGRLPPPIPLESLRWMNK